MTRSAEDALRQKLSEGSSERARLPFPQPWDPQPVDPKAFGRRVAAELFDEYVKESQERAKRKKR